MSEIVFKSTAEALEHVHTLKRCAEGFQNFGSEMMNARTTIQSNWDGDVTNSDIGYITGMLADLNREANDISECLNKLALGVDSFAQAINEIGNGGEGSSQQGFWAEQKQEFAENWDYSDCEDLGDYFSTTVGGLMETGADTVSFVVDGVSELIKWVF